MPVSVVVGGQFGSEGKGKTALEIVRRTAEPVVAIRVGGPNSGHTGYDRHGNMQILRQLPAACIDGDIDVVLPAGAYIDVEVFLDELRRLDYPHDRIRISSHARTILPQHRRWEEEGDLIQSIGSTGSGVGGAVMAAVARKASNFPLVSESASDDPRLKRFLDHRLSRYLRSRLDAGDRVIIEGTQGFGLSLLDGGYWPNATSRCTTASGALAESSLSPTDVDDVTMVIRAFPIRVAGNSGPLEREIAWADISKAMGLADTLREFTTVTKEARRVARFDPKVVRDALAVNQPTRIVLNHLDYLGREEDLDDPNSALASFILQTEKSIGARLDWLGFSPRHFIQRQNLDMRTAALSVQGR